MNIYEELKDVWPVHIKPWKQNGLIFCAAGLASATSDPLKERIYDLVQNSLEMEGVEEDEWKKVAYKLSVYAELIQLENKMYKLCVEFDN